MNIVKVKTKYQVTLPTWVRKQAGVNVGDILEAKVEKGNITLSPKTWIDKRLAHSLKQIEEGKVSGPFETAEEMIAELKKRMKKTK